jgi:pantoate--beta-alanine ligase
VIIKVISLNDELAEIVQNERIKGKTVGFVPTMGALHQGHLSLIEACKKNADFVICSIFVNPTQFNQTSDLDNYPRTLNSDLTQLAAVNCDLVYTPSIEEVYKNEAPINFDFAGLDLPMEGANRPGHFEGVVRVVKRLFEIVQPDISCFGIKDFQQLAIIKHMVEFYQMPIEIISCPIIRETSGLAMSSRNVRLSSEDVIAALTLSKALKSIQLNSSMQNVEACLVAARKILSENVELEYLEIADSNTLLAATEWSSSNNLRAFVAARVGDVRLIDNMELT